jgi:hypothetical protein
MKAKKGITLIALVITIVILLILATVAINGMLEGGLVGKAEDVVAKHNQELKNDEDELDRHDEMLEEIYGAGSIMPGEIAQGNVTYKDGNGDKATIPYGFKVSEKYDEQTIQDGLVVIDSYGNEFVWIPVNDINKMYMLDGAQKVGRLYATSPGNSFNENLTGQTYNPNSGHREPAIITGNSSRYRNTI